MNVKLLQDNVLVRPNEPATKTKAGLYIANPANKEQSNRGVVVAVGPGKKDEPINVTEGDEVLYRNYGNTEVEIEDVKYLIIPAVNIQLVFNK